MAIWGDLKKKMGSVFTTDDVPEMGEDYVELAADLKDSKAKVTIKPHTLNKFDDIRGVLNAIREGTTISILNIAPLKEKDRKGFFDTAGPQLAIKTTLSLH